LKERTTSILYRHNGKNGVETSVNFSDTAWRRIAADGTLRDHYRQDVVKSFVAIMKTRYT